jgi:hypothetical protein
MWSAFCGADGKVSMMRLLTFFVVVVILGIFIAHNVISMTKGVCGFVSFGYTDAALIAGALGIKAFQTKYENNGSVEPLTTDAVPTDKKE